METSSIIQFKIQQGGNLVVCKVNQEFKKQTNLLTKDRLGLYHYQNQ